MYEILRTDFEHRDDRGALIQLIHEGYEQINVLITHQGVARGGHGHRTRSEAFYVVSGRLKVIFEDRTGIKDEVIFQSGDFFKIHPMVIHSMYFLEDTVMVAMYDTCVTNADGTKDIYNAEDI